MKYCTFVKSGEIKLPEELLKLNDKYMDYEDNFLSVFNAFIDKNRVDTTLINQIYIENITSNIRQLI